MTAPRATGHSNQTGSQTAEKIEAARRSLDFVAAGMVVGLGSGSTAAEMVRLLGERVRAGLAIRGIPSSTATRQLALAAGIPLCDFSSVDAIDVTIDGADEVDPSGGMIKGRGGALLHEKILAVHSRRLVIVVDSTKAVRQLGTRTAVPVEVIPLAAPLVSRQLQGWGATITLRGAADGTPFISDEGNQILDCNFGPIPDPEALALRLDRLVGVVEHGLFLGLSPTLVVGGAGVPVAAP
jgi:ribose 5-phosphate isomerase A